MASLRARISDRVLVYLRRMSDDKLERAPFKKCILEHLGFNGLEALVTCTLEENRLILSSSNLAIQSQLLLKHPPFCPISNLSPADAQSIPQEVAERGVDCGVATLLWSCDRYLLLSRRAAHLRIFPGVWVPPGGHIELGETLVEAGLRELKEETGLEVNPEQCSPSLVALWESVYPPFLSRGLPTRHHIVVYQTATSSKTHQQLSEELCIDPTEVGATAWLEESMVRAVAEASHDFGGEPSDDASKKDIPDTIRAVVIDPASGQTRTEEMSTAVFTEKAPDFGEEIERLSTGTRFAMRQWCLRNPSK